MGAPAPPGEDKERSDLRKRLEVEVQEIRDKGGVADIPWDPESLDPDDFTS